MAEYEQYLATLDSDPNDEAALRALESLDNGELDTPEAAVALERARAQLRERGELEVVARLFDVEIAAVGDRARKADLLLAKGKLYADDLLNEQTAVECFRQVLALRPEDADASETLAQLDLVRDNWRKIADKYVDEAKASTDRQLTTSLYLSAAEMWARYEPESDQVERYLRKALEVEPRNRRAALHLERLLRRAGRWQDLAALLEQRADAAAVKEERSQALLALADVAKTRLNDPQLAIDCMKKLVAQDPAHPRALAMLADLYEKEQNWSALVMLYTNALKARRRSVDTEPETGILLQIAMLHWKRLGNPDAAEEYFRRIRKAEPGHPAALTFYREYYTARGEAAKLVQVLRQALKATADDDLRRDLSIEIARLSDSELANADKAIEAWKGVLRREPDNAEARAALERLYRATEKWNALLDLIKDEIDRLPPDDVDRRVSRLEQVVEIYRDRLHLDVMVINTYNTILQLQPGNRAALDALAAKYEQLGRWNDLIAVWARMAELPDTPSDERVELLRKTASLWADRFGNYAQAIKPLEQLLELRPEDRDAIAKLKEIYARRRQWRALIRLMERETQLLPADQRRAHLVDIARLASDRLGDPALSIGVWNRVLELDPDDAEALESLAHLYERNKRYLALAEVLHRQRAAIGDTDPAAAIGVLERLGAVYAERLGAADQAVPVLREILALDPGHARALRQLRELLVAAGDADALEALYRDVGRFDELVDVLSGLADRAEGDRKLALLERTAAIAEQHVAHPEKVARAYERILAVDPAHRRAAAALVPIYERTQKWARLLAIYEVLLGHATDVDEQLRLHLAIRKLAEERLGSKALAFQWAARAYELAPADAALLEDLERLGAEADAWQEVAAVLDRRLQAQDLPDDERLRLLRELGTIASTRLHRPDDARRYYEGVLAIAPDDEAAIAALERLFAEQGQWRDLLDVYRRRVALTDDDGARLDLLFKIAFLEEERLGDLDAAAATYREILDIDAGSPRALRALEKVEEARGDAGGLADVLERQLALAGEPEAQVGLLLRLGALYESKLGRRADALAGYRRALELSPTNRQVHAALERFLVAPADVDHDERADVARLLLPVYEQTDEPANTARCLEILRDATDDAAQRLAFDRRLAALYAGRLGDARSAYEAAMRVVEAAPDDRDARRTAIDCAVAADALDDAANRLDALAADAEAVDTATRRAIAVDVATIYDDRLGQIDRAEAAWKRVLELDSACAAAYDALDRIYRGAERWRELRDLLLAREQQLHDAERRKDLLLQVCDLDEGVLDDPDAAIDMYHRVLELDPGVIRAYKALERLYEAKEAWPELDATIERELDHLDPADDKLRMQRVALLYRRAVLHARALDDPAGAIDLLEQVVELAPGHTDGRELLEELLPNAEQRLRVARILEPLYRADGLWRDLVLVLRAQREFAATPREAVDLLAQVAQIESENLGHERGAFATWCEALRTDPSDPRPREALRRLAKLLDRWPDAAAAWEAAVDAADPADVGLRAALLTELAAMYDGPLGDGDQAIAAYRRLLDVDPGNRDVVDRAAAALERLYTDRQQWSDLRDILRRQAEWADTPARRRELLARVARLEEVELGDADAAIAAWRDLLVDVPDDAEALDALERLLAAREAWHELIDVLRRRVDLAGDAAERKAQLRRIASLYERELGDAHEAIAAHLEVLDHSPDDRETLAELARLYREAERWTDLLEVTERRLALAQDPLEIAEHTHELADLLFHRLGRGAEALERYAAVLRANPAHVAALAAVESMVDDDALRRRAADVLQPLYEAHAEHAKLAGLLQRLAESVDDPRERVRCLARVAELREHMLDDAHGAFDAYAQLLPDALAEPELAHYIDELERLAAEQGRMEELIEVFRAIAPDVFDGDLQRRIYLDIADLARAVLRDDEVARGYYQLVLDAQPDDPRAMAALEAIYRDAGEHARLYDVLARKAETIGDDIDAKAAALAEAAQLCADHLGRTDDAILHWEQVLELLPNDARAASALEKLYTEGSRWHDLADLLQCRLGFAYSVPEAVSLQFRLGQLYERELSDPDAAVTAYAATLGGDPNHAEATAALERLLDDPGTRAAAATVLEPVYVAHQDWAKLVRIYEIKLDAAEEPAERLALTRYIARLQEEQLEDLEEAFRWYGRVLRETPSDAAVRDQLARLATILENWSDYAAVLQEVLDDALGDTEDVRTIALALADVYDRRLGEVERAHAAYRRALRVRPDDRDTFARLEAMLSGAERWFALVDVYEQALADASDDAWRIELLARTARVQEERLQDVDRAIEAYRAIVDIDPGHRPALDALDRLYAASGQWYELAELLGRRLAGAQDDREAAALRLRLAELLESQLDDAAGAIDHYQTVLAGGGAEADEALAALERLVQEPDHQDRIARILEPLYRERDWWQKLVVLLHDARLPHVDDPGERVAMLREIARIHETRGGDPRLALAALARAWKEDVTSDEVYAEFEALAAKLGAWDELIAALEEGIDGNYDFDVVAKILARIAELHETRRHDNAKAIDAWRRLLEVSDEDAVALAALDRLLGAEGRADERVKIIERRAELADDDVQRKDFLYRIAEIHETALGDVDHAIATWRTVLNLDDEDERALDALERLYRATGNDAELALILGRKIEIAGDAATRRGLRLAAADLYDQRLNDPYEAIAQLRAVLDDQPDDAEALARLDEVLAREKMWTDLVEVIDRRAQLDAANRADLAYRAAAVVERELMEVDRAVERYAAVLDIDPSHADARAALERLSAQEDTMAAAAAALEPIYRAEGAHDALAELYERRIAAATGGDPSERLALIAALAEVHELSRADLDAAFATWARALADHPDEPQVRAELERLAQARGAWGELADLYARAADATGDAELEYAYRAQEARIYEEALGDLERAAAAYARALDLAIDEREPLAALDRIYERAGRWAELAGVLAREAEVHMDEARQAELLYRLGDVRERQLADAAGAVDAYRDVLDRDPAHGAARAGLERLLSSDAERGQIIAILEPLYEADGDYVRLADLLGAKLGIVDDAFERAQIYARLAEIAEHRLGDPVRALDATGGWLAEDPRSPEALAQLDRLADATGRWGEVAARLAGVIDSLDDPDVRRALQMHLGDVQLDRVGDAAAAEVTFRRIVDDDPDSDDALARLERIYRDRGDAAAVADILMRRVGLSYDPQAKRRQLVEVAQLREQIGDVQGAEAAWRQVLDLDEGDRDAHAQLARLYEQQQRWADLIDILGVAARFAGDADAERALRVRIARLYADAVGDMDAAADAWQAAVDLRPDDLDALEQLERVHAARGDWLSVQDVLMRRLDAVSTNAERAAIYRRLAAVAEQHRDAPDDAIGHLMQILDLDGADLSVYADLERLLAAAERWHDLVELYQRAAEVAGTLGDAGREIDYLAKAADVWEERLDAPDAAAEILEQILARDPNYVPALSRLARIYEAAADYDRCSDVLQRALALGPQGTDAADLYFRLGEMARHRGDDDEQVAGYFGEALKHDAAHPPTVRAVEAIARDREDWPVVADMLGRRLSFETDPAVRLDVTLELADLYRTRLGQPDAVIPLLEQAAAAAPDDERVAAPLADLYYAAGRYADARPVYERLADAAKAARRMKDVARYRQRLGAIAEALGDVDAARAAYEEAFRVNPTDVVTMAGLGRLYLAAQQWEKARRVYRSMVLQQIDPSLGISKADVYLALGNIHVQLGEPAKAKGMYQRGLELAPDHPELSRALAALEG
ncbi:MAG: tetratricopeptide repeat protein [Deltaproteobacteria bacterium]|nr:MAG: tetratricopeptide repeat protein [Deltaproteobacteria bacterium]